MTSIHTYLYGVHPVLAALTFRRRALYRLLIREDWSDMPNSKPLLAPWVSMIHEKAEQSGIPVCPVKFAHLSDVINGRAHQGVLLETGPLPVWELTQRNLSKILSELSPHNEPLTQECFQKQSRPILLLLDQLTDVMNVGSILRSAVFFGATAIILSSHPCIAPSSLISKLSAGAMETIPFYRLTSTVEDLKTLSDAGFMLVGTAGENTSPNSNTKLRPSWLLRPHEVGHNEDGGTGILPRPLVLAVGSESRGLSPEVLEACDLLLRVVGFQDCLHSSTCSISSIPSSLNVAVATGLLLYQLTLLRHHSGCTQTSCSDPFHSLFDVDLSTSQSEERHTNFVQD